MNRGKFACINSLSSCARRFFVSELRRRRYGTARGETTTAAPPTVLPFSIPAPIERSPTDLLEALSSTVGVDVTAPHFAFIDDPATIPSSNNTKQQYYMCKEFGKRAARQLAEEWPTLFMFDRDRPRLPVFRPEKPLDPLVVDASEANLAKMVAAREVESALALYERICADGGGVSAEATLDLFYLVCYYNGKDIPIHEIAEWHGLRNFNELERTKHDQNPNVDLLFAAVEKSADVYSAMICNRLKFFTEKSASQAIELFKEMREKGLTPAEEVFNLFLSTRVPIPLPTAAKKSANSARRPPWPDVVGELREMARIGVRPSVRTFNAAIIAALEIDDLKARWQVIRPLIAEMNVCGIAPTLTTFRNAILACFTKWYEFDWQTKHPPNELHVARMIAEFSLDELERRPSVELSEFTDERYFSVIRQLSEYTYGLDLMERAARIYADPKNKVVFSSFVVESSFYTRYLYMKLDKIPLEEFEELYVAHIPRVASLTMALSWKIIARLKLNKIWPLTRRVIEDGLINGFAENQKVSSEWQNLLIDFPTEKLSEAELDEYIALVRKLVNAWQDFNDFYDSVADRHQKFVDRKAAEAAATTSAPAQEGEGEEPAGLVPLSPPNEQAEKVEAKTHINFAFFKDTMVERGFLKVLE